MNTPYREFPEGVTFIVSKGDQAVPVSAVSPAARTKLINTANGGSAAVADGQIAIVNAETYEILRAADTVDTVPVIKIIQGNSNSADFRNAGPVNRLPFIESAPIDGRKLLGFTARDYDAGRYNAHIVTGITTSSEKDYQINMTWVSKRKDRHFSTSGFQALSVAYPTPDYSASGLNLNAANSTAHMIENLLAKVNKQSVATKGNDPRQANGIYEHVAFAIDVSGGSGTAVSDITSGTATNIDFITYSGSTYSTANTAQMQATFTQLVADSVLAATSTVEVIDTTTAGDGTRAVDGFIIVALDTEKAIADDQIPVERNTIRLGLDKQFTEQATDPVTTEVGGKETMGDGRKVALEYDSRARKMLWSNQELGYQEFLEYETAVIESENYNVARLRSADTYNVLYSHTVNDNHEVVFNIPTGDTTTIGDLNTILASWLNTAKNIEIDSSATSPDLF